MQTSISYSIKRDRSPVRFILGLLLILSLFNQSVAYGGTGDNNLKAETPESADSSNGGGDTQVKTGSVADNVGGDTQAKSGSVADNVGGDTQAKSSSVAEGNLTVDEVKIEGNRLVATEDIMGVVKTKRGDKFDRDQVLQDLKAINNMGYFDDRNLQVVPELTTGGVLLKIRVQENAPITEFSFQGNQVLSTDEISKVFSGQLGKPQNLNDLSSAVDKVEQAYHERGFVLARVTDVKDDPDGSVGLNINEGIIDKIEVTGNKKTKDFLIRNAIKVKPGQVYNERELTGDLRKLYANGYFQDIRRSLAPSPDNPDRYTLKVEVEEKRTGSVGLGGGVDTVAGPFGSFSIGDSNFRGRGEVLNLTTQVGTGMLNSLNAVNNGGSNQIASVPTYQVQATFVEPNIGHDTTMAVSGFGRDLNSFMIQQSMQRTLGASVDFSKSLGHHVNLNLGFTGEDVNLRDVSNLITNGNNLLGGMIERAIQTGAASGPNAYNLAQSVRSSQLKGGAFASVSPSISYDTRDAKLDATTGTLLRLSTSPSLGLTGAGFTKIGASASKFVKINESMSLATNVQGGMALGNVPQFGQYWLGGMNGMRGYPQFTGLGTGTRMLMATAELRTRLPFLHQSDNKFAKAIDKHLKGVVFFDAGQVSGNNLTNSLLSRNSLGASTGLGVRINVPMIGLIRIDYGLPLVSSLLGHMTPRITIGFGDRF
jgi:outer membrane protein insertion porin family